MEVWVCHFLSGTYAEQPSGVAVKTAIARGETPESGVAHRGYPGSFFTARHTQRNP